MRHPKSRTIRSIPDSSTAFSAIPSPGNAHSASATAGLAAFVYQVPSRHPAFHFHRIRDVARPCFAALPRLRVILFPARRACAPMAGPAARQRLRRASLAGNDREATSQDIAA
jgi:hypothetical protein